MGAETRSVQPRASVRSGGQVLDVLELLAHADRTLGLTEIAGRLALAAGVSGELGFVIPGQVKGPV